MSDVQELVQQLESLIASGNEAETKRFVIEHFKEFPIETQQDLAVSLFEDALSDELSNKEALAAIKKDAVRAMNAVDAIDQAETN